jgi:hypothetical protein
LRGKACDDADRCRYLGRRGDSHGIIISDVGERTHQQVAAEGRLDHCGEKEWVEVRIEAGRTPAIQETPAGVDVIRTRLARARVGSGPQ